MNDQKASYEERFDQAFALLNEQQRMAVEQTEGPVMVLAGPGTGKTHLLATRVGQILRLTDAGPANILCLTFTDAGVQAMRNRLLELIGPAAHQVHIFTFHSFGSKVIQENLDHFGWRDLEPLNELERIVLLEGLLDALPPENPLKRGRGTDPHFHLPHLRDLFSRMKSENWSAEQVREEADAFLASLPEHPDFIYKRSGRGYKKGELKKALVEKVFQRMERLKAGAELFEIYNEALLEARRYDYDDMLHWVLEAFCKDEFLLRRYQEQYLYFLVDEYQDTNGVQNDLLLKLIDYWEQPNIFIVGDDDQSIFEFQGARLKNLVSYYLAFREEMLTVVLDKNYRSSQFILDAAGSLIRENRLRAIDQLRGLGLTKDLIAADPGGKGAGQRPEIRKYPALFQELADVVRQIREWSEEGVPFSEIAVIYARHRQSNALIRLLERSGIPFRTRRKTDLLDLPVIREVLRILEYLDNEYRLPFSDDQQLFRILHHPCWGIRAVWLARLAASRASHDRSDQIPFRELIADRSAILRAGIRDPAPFLSASRVIESLADDHRTISLFYLAERILNRSGLLQWARQQADRLEILQALHTLMDVVAESIEESPQLDIREFLTRLDSFRQHRVPIEVREYLQTEPGVQLLTAHSAKGLEFRRVVLLDCTAENWHPSERAGQYRFRYPDTLTFSGEADALEARRRLFYVALTRARDEVVMTWSSEDNKGKARLPAVFLEEMKASGTVVERATEGDPEGVQDAQNVLLGEKPAGAQPIHRAWVDEKLENFPLSISALNRYLACPLSFYYEYILELPAAPGIASLYGTALHKAMQRLFSERLRSPEKVFPPSDLLLQFFEEALSAYRGFLGEKGYAERLEAGRSALSGYYQEHVGEWSGEVLLEKRLREVQVKGIPLSGVVDRIDLLGGRQARIVDYKTGIQKSGRTARPSGRNPHGGIFWRQLVYYKLLLESDLRTPLQVPQGQISYLEPDKSGRFVEESIELREEDAMQLTGILETAYSAIREHRFTEGCGRENCRWCSFEKGLSGQLTLSDPEIESLDDPVGW